MLQPDDNVATPAPSHLAYFFPLPNQPSLSKSAEPARKASAACADTDSTLPDATKFTNSFHAWLDFDNWSSSVDVHTSFRVSCSALCRVCIRWRSFFASVRSARSFATLDPISRSKLDIIEALRSKVLILVYSCLNVWITSNRSE